MQELGDRLANRMASLIWCYPDLRTLIPRGLVDDYGRLGLKLLCIK